MSYLGNAPALAYTSFVKQDFTVTATTSYSLDHPVANANEIALFINFVRQEPTASYSASGTTLTLTEATSSSDDMYCVFLGKAVQTVNPPNGSVGTAQLVDDAVTKDKLSAHNYPAFRTTLSSDFNIGDATSTTVVFDNVTLDTNSCYDNSTGYFTPTVAGWYKLNTNIIVSSPTTNGINRMIVTLNTIVQDVNVANCTRFAINISDIAYFNGTTDTLRVRVYTDVDSGNAVVQANDSSYSGFRIGA
jgi:hypothetical protein